ncbi:hypothetical protein L4670_001841 [Pseudomonas aeruginosa]
MARIGRHPWQLRHEHSKRSLYTFKQGRGDREWIGAMRFRIDANNIASLDDSSAPVRWVDQFLMSALLRITQFASINLS